MGRSSERFWRRFLWTAAAATIALSPAATLHSSSQEEEGISEPPGRICWKKIKDSFNDHELIVAPLQAIDEEAHRKCRDLIGGDHGAPGKGFLFFLVVVDNHRGREPVTFNAFGGDAHFHYYPPPPVNADPRDEPPRPSKYGFVSLKNYFADPGNAPKDKSTYKHIQKMFRTRLVVPPGSHGWSLTCIRDRFIFDLRRNKVTWAIPGAPPREMDLKRFSKRLLDKADVRLSDEN